MEEGYTTLKFNSPTGLVQLSIRNDICIDPNTNLPFKYAVVHGNTWRTTLHAELPDLCEAFTPGGVPELNHRGIYEYCANEKVYCKYKYSDYEEEDNDANDEPIQIPNERKKSDSRTLRRHWI